MNKNLKHQSPSTLFNFRRTFTVIVILNVIFVIERTVFDFMGFMFGMIIADLIYLLFLIIGLFGAYQYRVNYIVMCILISLGWLAWNIFVICVYLNIGMLNRYDPFVLNLNTGKRSWFFVSSFGCKKEITNELEQIEYQDQFNVVKSYLESSTLAPLILQTSTRSTSTSGDMAEDLNLFKINNNLENFIQANCIMPFYLIEITHSGVFIFLGIFCVIFGILLSNTFNEEDDTFDYIGGFDTTHIITTNINSEQQPTLPRNGHIRLEPLYA